MNKNSLQHNLVEELSQLIEQGKHQIAVQVNSTMTLVFWEVGKRINEEILQNERLRLFVELSESIANLWVGCLFGTPKWDSTC